MAETQNNNDARKRSYRMAERMTVGELLERLKIKHDPVKDEILSREVIRPIGTSPRLDRAEQAIDLAGEEFEDSDEPTLIVVADGNWDEGRYEFIPAKRRMKKLS